MKPRYIVTERPYPFKIIARVKSLRSARRAATQARDARISDGITVIESYRGGLLIWRPRAK